MENKIIDSEPIVTEDTRTLVFDKKENKYILVDKEWLIDCGIDFDEDGSPIWFTVPEWFDELDRGLIEDFEKQETGKGEEFRQLANKRRARWNSEGTWHFNQL